jgi:hypothetical protein
MWFHYWPDSRKSGSPARRALRGRKCCRSARTAGSKLFLERLEDRNLLDGGLSPTLVALGGATPRPIPLPLALAANPLGGMDIYQNFQGPADANPQVTPLLGNEPNQITDFFGFYGGVRVQGTGIGHQGNEANHSFFWDADLRFMKGIYRGVDGNLYAHTFLEV